MILDLNIFMMTPSVAKKLSAHHSTNLGQWGVWLTEKKWKNDLKTPHVSLSCSLRTSNLPFTISNASLNKMVSNISAFSSTRPSSSFLLLIPNYSRSPTSTTSISSSLSIFKSIEEVLGHLPRHLAQFLDLIVL